MATMFKLLEEMQIRRVHISVKRLDAVVVRTAGVNNRNVGNEIVEYNEGGTLEKVEDLFCR